jgi:S-DNA-T family DNA segregation ATPase FtsK/SpoIIIE
MSDHTDTDPLYDEAVSIAIETKPVNCSTLQRRLAIGYTRASRLIELMEKRGVIKELSPGYWRAVNNESEGA